MHGVVRTGAAIAAGILCTAALTSCSGDSAKSDERGGSTASDRPGRQADDNSGSGTDAAALEGGWAGKTDGKAVVLSVASGKAVLVTEQHACTGTVQGAGKVTLTLKCVDGDDRTSGSVDSNDGKTAVISWDSGVKDTLAKTDPGALPSGLPDLADLPTTAP
ncbi:hypothetical protein [Streptomyces sp. NPDC018352]|uniref:hypothetical protein n=1 Tax=Streptomyces sp. NPDC018352 TaxID=3157194 RepID=UPI0033F163D1